MPKTETRTDKLQQAHDRLTQAVEQIVTGDDWARILKTAAKFHRYSFNNQLLIMVQRPDATQVAGFLRWKSLGRLVRKGEKGIAILAPVVYRSPNGPSAASVDREEQEQEQGQEPIKTLTGFKVVHVFDVSQTEGEELELDAVKPVLLDGAAPEGLWDDLVAQASAAGYSVVRAERGRANGYCDFVNEEIGIDSNLPDLQAVKTLVHELAHALLHSDDRTRERARQEVEVESTAFVVLTALGLDSGTYSFPYVARWAEGDVDLIKESAQRSVACASSILMALEASARPARSAQQTR